METLREKLARIEKTLDSYKEGEPLPISISDIYFILGSCSQLLKNVDTLERSYKNDFIRLNSDLDKFRNKWKEARTLAVQLDNKIMAMKKVVAAAKSLPWLFKTKALKSQLRLLENNERKQNKLTLVDR